MKLSSRKELLDEAQVVLNQIRKRLVKEDAESEFWKKVLSIMDKQLMTKFVPQIQPTAKKDAADLLRNLFRYDATPLDEKTAMVIADLYVQYKSGKLNQDGFISKVSKLKSKLNPWIA